MASIVCFNSIPHASAHSSYLHGHGRLVPSCCSKSPIRIGTPRGMGGKAHRSLKATNFLQRIVETRRDEGAAPAQEWENKNTSSFIIIPAWALLTSPPALALTKYTDQEWVQIAITSAIVLFAYIIVVPLIIFNYLRLRWFKRNLPETIFQFLLVFMFFPGAARNTEVYMTTPNYAFKASARLPLFLNIHIYLKFGDLEHQL